MSDTARCPSCGGALPATTAVCPACGFAVRRRNGSAAPWLRARRSTPSLLRRTARSTARATAARGLGAVGAQPPAPRERAFGRLGSALAGLGRRSRDALVGALHHSHGAPRHHHRGARHTGGRHVARPPASSRRARVPPAARPRRRACRRPVAYRRAAAAGSTGGASRTSAGDIAFGACSWVEPITVAAARARERGRRACAAC